MFNSSVFQFYFSYQSLFAVNQKKRWRSSFLICFWTGELAWWVRLRSECFGLCASCVCFGGCFHIWWGICSNNLQKNLVKSFSVGSSVLFHGFLLWSWLLCSISSVFHFLLYQSCVCRQPKKKKVTKQFLSLFSDWWFGLAGWIMVWMFEIEWLFCLFER